MALAAPALAQPDSRPKDPDFPCVQVLVPSLSPGQIWAGPPVEELPAGAWRQDAEVAALVAQAGDRRVSTDRLTAAIDAFAGPLAPAERDRRLTLLFAGLFEAMQAERAGALDAIRRTARLQRDLLARIGTQVGSLNALGPDDPGRAELSESITWDRRVLDDRRRMLATLCERPGLVERKLGTLARAVVGHLSGG